MMSDDDAVGEVDVCGAAKPNVLRRKGRARGIELPKGSGCNGEGGGCGACAQADEKMRMKQQLRVSSLGTPRSFSRSSLVRLR